MNTRTMPTLIARPVLDLDTMAAITEDAGRAALSGRADASPYETSRAMRAVIGAPDANVLTAARLYRAAFRGALHPATD